MKFRIYNTENRYTKDTLDHYYFEKVKECFGEIEKRYVYDNLNNNDYEIEYYVEVESLDQLIDFQNKLDNHFIIDKEDDNYVYIKEVDRFVYLENNKNSQVMSIEIYDDYRE